MRYSFHPGALEESLGAVEYYSNISQHLGGAFVGAVEGAIERILSHPKAWPCVEGEVRRHVLARFPFGIYYCCEGETIVIYALMHRSRRPDYWRDRTR